MTKLQLYNFIILKKAILLQIQRIVSSNHVMPFLDAKHANQGDGIDRAIMIAYGM